MTAESILVENDSSVYSNDSGTYGILYYSFDWTNFATAANTSMAIGDAFSNESFMFGNGRLSILLPTGYTVKSCSPSPDQNSSGLIEWDDLNSSRMLEWNSVGDLQDGQPTILLSQETVPEFSLTILPMFMLLVLVFALVLRSKRGEKGRARF